MDLNKRKVSEFEADKVQIMNKYIEQNKINPKNDDLKFTSKLKK